MSNYLKLWVNGASGRLLSSSSSFVSAQPTTFFSGDQIDLEVHLVESVGVASVPYEVDFPAGAAVKVAIGSVATAPTGGNWRLSVSSTETADLAYNATPFAVETALNAIGAVAAAGGVTVNALGGGYAITWNTVGTKPSILAGTDTLTPAAYESVYVLQAGSATIKEIVFVELRQSPVALADTFVPVGAPVITATTVSAWNGTNKAVRIKISPAPKSGTYTIDIDGVSAACNAFDNTSNVQANIATAGITTVEAVYQVGELEYDIILSDDLTVTVDGSGLIQSPAMVGTISLATPELLAFLGSEATKSASIEVTITAAGKQRTMAQTNCTLANGVVTPGAVSPVTFGVVLTEAVADARFVRKDILDTPSAATLDIIWPNLGVTVDGSDLAAALSAANAPASGNAIATMADIPAAPDLTPYLLSATAASTYQTIAGMSSYLTTASASSTYQTISGMSSYLTTATAASTYLTISSAASTYALLSSFDQGVKTTDSPTFATVTVGGTVVDSLNLTIGGTITFPDATTQDTRIVRETQANGSGFSTGGFDTAHYPNEVKVIDDTGTAYWVPARLA